MPPVGALNFRSFDCSAPQARKSVRSPFFVGARQLVRGHRPAGAVPSGTRGRHTPVLAHQLASARHFFLALASWCAMRGRMCKIGGVVSGEIPGRGGDYPCPSIKKHAGWTPIVSVWRHTMRATDGLQTTITLGSVKPSGQVFSLELSLEMSLPMPQQ